MLDVAASQFVGRSMSVFLTFNICFCTVYLCWTWLYCSCWSLNISAFSNNYLLTIMMNVASNLFQGVKVIYGLLKRALL